MSNEFSLLTEDELPEFVVPVNSNTLSVCITYKRPFLNGWCGYVMEYKKENNYKKTSNG